MIEVEKVHQSIFLDIQDYCFKQMKHDPTTSATILAHIEKKDKTVFFDAPSGVSGDVLTRQQQKELHRKNRKFNPNQAEEEHVIAEMESSKYTNNTQREMLDPSILALRAEIDASNAKHNDDLEDPDLDDVENQFKADMLNADMKEITKDEQAPPNWDQLNSPVVATVIISNQLEQIDEETASKADEEKPETAAPKQDLILELDYDKKADEDKPAEGDDDGEIFF